VFAPLFMFRQIEGEQFADKVEDVLDRIKNNTAQRRGVSINSMVVDAFAGVKPESLHGMHDVAAVYGKLFASIDDKADEYLDACRKATTTDPIPGFRPGAGGPDRRAHADPARPRAYG
jgi:hypothetical protein